MVLNKIKSRLFGNEEPNIEIGSPSTLSTDEEKARNLLDMRKIAEAEELADKPKQETEMTVREEIIEAREQRKALDQEDGKSGSYTEGPYAGLLDTMEFHKEDIVKDGSVDARIPIGGTIVLPVRKEDGAWAVHKFKLGRRLKMDEVVLFDTIMNDLNRSPLLREAKKTGEFHELMKRWVNKVREKMDLPIPTWRNSWDQYNER